MPCHIVLGFQISIINTMCTFAFSVLLASTSLFSSIQGKNQKIIPPSIYLMSQIISRSNFSTFFVLSPQKQSISICRKYGCFTGFYGSFLLIALSIFVHPSWGVSLVGPSQHFKSLFQWGWGLQVKFSLTMFRLSFSVYML